MSSASYVAGRLAQMIPTVLLVAVLTFFLVHLLPGDPAVVCWANVPPGFNRANAPCHGT